MRKKLLIALMAGALAVSALAGCSNSSKTTDSVKSTVDTNLSEGEKTDEDNAVKSSDVLKDGKNDVLTIVFPGNSSAPASLEQVEAAITEIAQETMDCTVKINIFEWGVFEEQSNLILSSGEDVDLLFKWNNTAKQAGNSGQVIDISGLVPVYARETNDLMGKYIEGCYVGDALYGIPSYHEFATRAGLICSTELLEKLEINADDIKTWDDVDEVLAKAKEAFPDKDVLVPAEAMAGMLNHYNDGVFDAVQNAMVGIYTDGRDGLTAHNIYATDEFKEAAERAYAWNQKGYFIADSTTITDTRQTFLRAGSCFGYIGIVHPGTKTQESINAGADVSVIPITKQGSGTSNIASGQFVIPTGSPTPEKAVALLNLICSNADVQNLLHYGIEGVDYEVKAEGVAGYPNGIDASNVGWTNETWLTGNASIGLAWETDPVDVWEQYNKYNSEANFAPSYGFAFDSGNVKNEITAVQNVLDKYTAMIYSGMADPAESIPAFLGELDSAGMQKIVDEVQAQLDAWSKAQ
ncbi:MAG: ABC transporter substrate-binding protein [Lachnospiraceae bacterium]|nr:ABC transporter substrate-binding protein [Lachnospiraceae bacterium]